MGALPTWGEHRVVPGRVIRIQGDCPPGRVLSGCPAAVPGLEF